MAVRLDRPDQAAGHATPEALLQPALEFHGLNYGDSMALVGAFVDAVLEGTLTPKSWPCYGPLPTHVDGLKQTQVVLAIVESAETGRVVEVRKC